MDVNQLEDEYTPSLFSKRFENREELFDHYNKFTKEGERKIKEKMNKRSSTWINSLNSASFQSISSKIILILIPRIGKVAF